MRKLALRSFGAVCACLNLAGCGGSSSDRVSYVKANEALVSDLPTYPDADLRTKFSVPHRQHEDGPIVGYTTINDYLLPQATHADDVALFYEQRLQPHWRLVERLDHQDGPTLKFRKGNAVLFIDLEGLSGHQLEVAVDNDRYRH